MLLHFNRVARGPAWERWLILEDQRGDTAMAGEIILTYGDIGVYADVECSVLFTRDLKDEEVEEVLNAVSTILSGRGNVTVYATQEVACQAFSLVEEGEEEEE